MSIKNGVYGSPKKLSVEYGGLGQPYKYHAALLEELGSINSTGVAVSISAHTDVAVPPLARCQTFHLYILNE